MLTKEQAITVWNAWIAGETTRPLLSFIGLFPSRITADETDENTRGYQVHKIQTMKAADFLRSMAVSLDGYVPYHEDAAEQEGGGE